MCRFLAYKGREVFLSDLLTRTDQSLIRQSFKAREREEPLNGDGFGVGWYALEVDPEPCVFTSITPAWSNRNLHRLADKIQSTCVFAHVRAASPGSLVTETNCHPFQHGRFLWMHNGLIDGFGRIRRRLRASLSDEVDATIQGTTDSEHLFALFLEMLRAHGPDYSADTLETAVRETLVRIAEWTAEADSAVGSTCNVAVTDGHNVVATRFNTHPDVPAPSLYVARGERFESVDGAYRMRPPQAWPEAVIVASEPLTATRSDWEKVPDGHLVAITPEMYLRVEPIQ